MAEVAPTDPVAAETAMDDNEEEESKEILLMKQRVEEMEREAKKLRELQAAAEGSTTSEQAGEEAAPMETEDDKALIDSRSVFVGNVDYSATAEDIQAHFQACGTINRITILCDKFTGHPKGFAYVEFAEPEFIDPALALDNSLFHGRLIKVSTIAHCPAYTFAHKAASSRTVTTSARPYPYSQAAIIPPPRAGEPPAALRQGKGLMAYLQSTLSSTEKQKIMSTLFSRNHPDRIRPGSVLTVNLTHAPTSFSGVLVSVRRRGPDTSFVLRNVVQRTGVEMQFFVNSPHVKEIVVVSRVGGPNGKKVRGLRKAKLFYLRDSPERMTAVAAGVRS
ncbi:hypothetical protein BC834DRAFT_820638 [Gloeopeniophorella convolvens]|nr:hypothetical protein BC834DRAFT_820638 [Gloeopeniophorella convolvens]